MCSVQCEPVWMRNVKDIIKRKHLADFHLSNMADTQLQPFVMFTKDPEADANTGTSFKVFIVTVTDLQRLDVKNGVQAGDDQR